MSDRAAELAGGPALARGIGPWQATALNVTMIVGAGVFVTIPAMLGKLPGPYALLGWLAAGAIILADGFVWVASARDGSVTRVNPDTADIETIDVGGTPTDIAVGPGALWVAVDVR